MHEILRAQWKQVFGRSKERQDRPTVDAWDRASGLYGLLAGILQRYYGHGAAYAEVRLSDFRNDIIDVGKRSR
jgi:hypothetical protein